MSLSCRALGGTGVGSGSSGRSPCLSSGLLFEWNFQDSKVGKVNFRIPRTRFEFSLE